MSSQLQRQLSATDNVVPSSLPRQLHTYPHLNDSETQSSHDLSDPDKVAPHHDRERGLSDERWNVFEKLKQAQLASLGALIYHDLVVWESSSTHS